MALKISFEDNELFSVGRGLQKKNLSLEEICSLVIEQTNCRDQEEIKQHLLKLTGKAITQSTLSRVLSAIGATKVRNSVGVKVYKVVREKSPEREQGIVKSLIKSVYHNNDWVLVRTEYGCAKLIAKLIEAEPNFEILGCVAGADTVIVAPRSIKKLEVCLAIVKEKLGFS